MIMGGKTQALIKMLNATGLNCYFDFNDLEHEKEIREQLLATEGRGNYKINWCMNLLSHYKFLGEMNEHRQTNKQIKRNKRTNRRVSKTNRYSQ